MKAEVAGRASQSGVAEGDSLGVLASVLGPADPLVLRSTPFETLRIATVFLGLLAAGVGIVASAVFAFTVFAWPRTPEGTCFVWQPDWCTSLTIAGVERVSGISFPRGSVVVRSRSDEGWGRSAEAIVRLPEGERLTLPSIYRPTPVAAVERESPLGTIGVRDLQFAALANRDRWILLAFEGHDAHGVDYISVSADWNS